MNILVVNPPNKPFTNSSILAEPIDVLQIATIIKNKYNKVKVIDMDVDRLNNDITKFLSDNNIIIFVFDYQLPLHTTDTIYNIFEIIKNCTKPAKFIMIGKTSSYYYEKFLQKGIDIVVNGIAEKNINDVIDCIINNKDLKCIPNISFKNGNEIVITENKQDVLDFGSLDIPNRSFVKIDKYMDTRTIVSSRGCVGNCAFCTTPTFFGKWCGKNSKIVVEEIEYLIKNYNTKKIIFLDDNMTVDKNRMYQICDEIKKRNIKCLFGCLSSIGCYDDDMFKKMYDVGFRWVHFGIESGSSRILKLMNKPMNFEYIKKVIKNVKDIGFRVRISIILDYPTSTKEDIKQTRNLVKQLQPHELRLHYLAYRVGTPVFENNKNIDIKTQYIHSNHPNVKNDELIEEISLLIDDLKKDKYLIISENVDWTKYNTLEKETKIAAFTPIKYGLCWYE